MILDTFTILFQADAKALDDGLEKSDKASDDLMASLKKADKAAAELGAELAGAKKPDLDVDASGLKQAEHATGRLNNELKDTDKLAQTASGSLTTAIKSVAALALGFLAAGAAKSSFTETVNELVNIGRISETLGLAAEDVDAFSRSMVAMGGDSQGARDSLIDMAESIGEAVQDVESGRAKVYATLGITLKDVNGQAITATEGMLRLADAVSGMSKEEAIFRIKELGVTDNKTVELILKGRKEMERMLAVQKEQSGVTKESIENARKYQEAMFRLNNAQDSVTTQIANKLLPIFTKMIDAIAVGVEWMSQNKQTVMAFFGAIAGIVLAMYLPAMLAAAAATLAATWPLIAMGALITGLAAAFALLYDDIQNFLAGNDSLIGQISEKFPIVGEIVRGVADGINDAWQTVKQFVMELWDVLAPLGAAFGDIFGAIGGTIMSLLDLIGSAVSKIMQLIGVDMTGSFDLAGAVIKGVMDGIVGTIRIAVGIITGLLSGASKLISGVGSIAGKVSSFFGGGEQTAQNMATGNQALAMANASPLNAATSNSISNSVASTNRETNVQVGEVIVQTQATDAEGISRDVGNTLQTQLAQVDAEFSTGVAR